MVAILKDESNSDELKEQAIKILTKICYIPSLDLLLEIFNNEKSSFSIRFATVEALGNFKDPRMVEALIKALDDRAGLIRRSAATVLVYMYQSGKLDEKLQANILFQANHFSERHTDETSKREHQDYKVTWTPSDCSPLHFGEHVDEPTQFNHNDRGIGVDFKTVKHF